MNAFVLLDLSVNSTSRTSGTIAKANRRCTHSNKCMTMQTLWCLSAGEPPRPLSLVTRWAPHVHPRNLLMSLSWDFCLSLQYQVTLFFYFFLIKSQQQCYLTLIWSQLNPCLNLWRCGVHSNLLSIQPSTPLGLVSGRRKSFWLHEQKNWLQEGHFTHRLQHHKPLFYHKVEGNEGGGELWTHRGTEATSHPNRWQVHYKRHYPHEVRFSCPTPGR